MDRNTTIGIEVATADDLGSVRGVLDAALLETMTLEPAINAGRVLVATFSDGGTILGAVVVRSTVPPADEPVDGTLTGPHISALAVRPGRRGQGIGTRLVREAADRWESLSAAYEADLAPLYEASGFTARSKTSDGRIVGETNTT